MTTVRSYKIEQRDGKWCVLSEDGSEVLGCHPTEDEAKQQLAAVEAAKNTQKYCLSCVGPAPTAALSRLFDEMIESRESDMYYLISTLQDSIYSILNDTSTEASAKESKLSETVNQFLAAVKDRRPNMTAFNAAVESMRYAAVKMPDDAEDPEKKKKPVVPAPEGAETPAADDAAGEDEDPTAEEKDSSEAKKAKDQPEMYKLGGVEIFATGTHNGDKYSEADLDEMVRAFKDQGYIPPLKAGHDETPGRPALGWVENVRRVGAKLIADFTHLPKDVYDLIKRRGYDRVSSEIYWNLKSGGKTFRRAVKAVALLGADVPAVTSLAPLHTLFSGLTGDVKFYDGGKGMATSDKETLEALTKQIAEIQVAMNSSGAGIDADPTTLKQLSLVSEQVRVLSKRVNETAAAEQTVLQQSEALEKAHKRIEALEEDRRRDRVKAIIEDVKIPAFRPYFQALLDVATRDQRVVKFTKRDGKEEEMTVERVVKEFIQAINDGTRSVFKEFTKSDGGHRTKDGADIDLEDRQAVASYVDRKTREYQGQYKCDYSTALSAVLTSEPEVKTAYLT